MGIDISQVAGQLMSKPFVTSSATELPFHDNSFGAIWSNFVLEHVPDPDKALFEMRRVLEPNGILILNPAWQCRSWAAQGYPVRSYSEFNFLGKLVKASIPFRNSVIYRSFFIFPKRISQYVAYLIDQKPQRFVYSKLKANFDHFWMSDSDAVNSMDPYSAILWFFSRSDECINYPGWFSRLFVRTGATIFRIIKK